MRPPLGARFTDVFGGLLPREVVEGGAEVEGDLPSDDGEHWRDWSREVEIDAMPARVSVCFYPAGIGLRVDPSAPFVCEDFEPFLGPCDLGAARGDGGLVHSLPLEDDAAQTENRADTEGPHGPGAQAS